MKWFRSQIHASFLWVGSFLVSFTVSMAAAPAHDASPNIVIIFADDLGYNDLGCFGSKIKTPNLDRMAAEGVRFTSFYVAQAICSASRAALMTGCYNTRLSIFGALPPHAKIG